MKKKTLFSIVLAGLVGAATGLFLALQAKKKEHDDAPPKGAPQLLLQNPGDQSEFPTAPEEERTMG